MRTRARTPTNMISLDFMAADDAGLFKSATEFLALYVTQPRSGVNVVHTISADGASKHTIRDVPEFGDNTNILSDAVKSCYQALGIVHWSFERAHVKGPPTTEHRTGVVAVKKWGIPKPEAHVRSQVWKTTDVDGHPYLVYAPWVHVSSPVPFLPWRDPVVLGRLRTGL